MRTLLLLLIAVHLDAATVITIDHFSDYHSHAVPFYSGGRDDQGGIARAIGYLKREKANGALVFSGGDMINKGSPAWSDKYRCAEWPWLNGVVDAMAFGNHDADYGLAEFEKCRDSLRYPILSANTNGFKPYAVFRRGAVRIGVFALAGPDFPSLVHVPGFQFSDAIAAARKVVDDLRKKEHVDVVVMIGHEQLDDDVALAQAVPGIDLILGTHSHLKQELTTLPGTKTWFLSPFQYLTYISRVKITVDNHRVVKLTGELVPVDDKLPSDPVIARRVAAMQGDLERDPEYAPLFKIIGRAATPLDVEGHLTRDAPFDDLIMDLMREVSKSDAAISTASSFRQSIPAGPITFEALRATLPYDNEILVFPMSGEQLEKVVAYGTSRTGSDFFAQVSGLRYLVSEEKDPLYLSIGNARIDKKRIYRIATTDYVARVAPGYRELFAGITPEKTGLKIREEVRKYIEAHSPVSAKRDGRIEPEVR